jgi:predicted 3-demethylubiquinone-9 3-methyltransferase (glyoxalase superfamily)
MTSPSSQLPKLATCLWFDGNAVEAVQFYQSVFDGFSPADLSGTTSRFRQTNFPPDARGEAGTPMTVEFVLDGHTFVALNGGAHFAFTEAISFMIYCEDQPEVDYFWGRLLEGGTASQCGWLKDQFGVSWQVIPRPFMVLMGSDDGEAVQAMVQAMMQMVKLDLAVLQSAFNGG